MSEEVPIEPKVETISVPWTPGTSVSSEPPVPRARLDRRAEKARQIRLRALDLRARADARRKEGKYPESLLASMDVRAAFEERRADAAERVAMSSPAELKVREDALRSDLGVEVAYLEEGVPIDRVLDQRLLDELAELSLILLALREA